MRWKQFLTPVQSISASEARQLLDKGSLADTCIVDVRQPGEYEKARIPGAHLIPLPALTDRVGEIDPSATVLVYCSGGVRSRIGAQILAGKGYERVFHLRGGIMAWEGQTATGSQDSGLDLVLDLDSPEQVLARAYSLEEGMRDFYLRMQDQVGNEQVQAVFRLLAGIEIKHKDRIFAEYTRLTGKNDRGEFECSLVEPLAHDGLHTQEFVEQFMTGLDSDVEVVSMAMSIEAQAQDLYSRAAMRTSNPENQTVLEHLAFEEKMHLARLSIVLDNLVEVENDI
ncbi:rhodanese-like domain-containing protein [Desulfovibrionales bacterium]